MYKWEYDNPSATYPTRILIVKSTANLVAYDRGYKYLFSHTNIILWDKIMDNKILSGAQQDNDVRLGSIAYVHTID